MFDCLVNLRWRSSVQVRLRQWIFSILWRCHGNVPLLHNYAMSIFLDLPYHCHQCNCFCWTIGIKSFSMVFPILRTGGFFLFSMKQLLLSTWRLTKCWAVHLILNGQVQGHLRAGQWKHGQWGPGKVKQGHVSAFQGKTRPCERISRKTRQFEGRGR